MYSLEYQDLPYKGKTTRVFAYYAIPGSIMGNPSLDRNLPGVILIHGGRDYAEEGWVRSWAKFGYAALATDLEGCGPDKKPFPNAVPSNDYLNFDWNYHTVANVILIDKNSLWGGLNIQKGQLCVKGILAQDLGFVLGAFQWGFGGFSG